MVFKVLAFILLFSQYCFSQYAYKKFVGGITNPVAIENCGDSRLFVVEQKGKIRIVDALGNLYAQPFLNITHIVKSIGGEQGLLGLAFSPNYKTDKSFYVCYTDTSVTSSYDCNIAVARYKVSSSNPDVADSLSGQLLLQFLHPYGNHNGGCLKFGADGYLYISSGDGGSGGDPFNSGQSLNSLLGKILRIDVNTSDSYRIPPDNPFINDTTILPEIWHYGLRNPWRFSFDRVTKDMWIGDVGQNLIEEIDKSALSTGGLNFGWRCREGTLNYDFSLCDSSSFFINPVYQYTHSTGCSVTGGYVYRGALSPTMYGKYYYSDYCMGVIWKLTTDSPFVNETAIATAKSISSFGEDRYGELYFASLGDTSIYKLIDTIACRPVSVSFNKPDSIYYCGDSLLLSFLPYNSILSSTWYKNDTLIENNNADKNIFYAKEKGSYKVKVAKSDTCFILSEIILVDNCTPASYDESIRFYPNPAKNNIELIFISNQTQLVQLVIFDMHGRTLNDFTVTVNKGVNTISVSLAGMTKGVYVINVISKEKKHKQKFVKL